MKHNLLIPIAGKGSRFVEQGYTIPKQLITAQNKQCLDWSLESFKIEDFNLIFIIREEHKINYSLDEVLISKYGPETKVVVLSSITRGSVESCLFAEEYIDNNNPLTIFTMDVAFLPVVTAKDLMTDHDGMLLTFKSNSPNYSYAQYDEKFCVTRTAEKEVISDRALVGVYHFKTGSSFVKNAHILINKDIKSKNEFYIAPMYNLLIESGMDIAMKDVNEMHLFGTPEELDFYENIHLRSKHRGPVGLCSDHSGFSLKESTKIVLEKFGIQYIDYGSFHDKDCDYNDFVKLAICAFADNKINKIFSFCRTGQGVNMCGSKYKNILSALIYDLNSAKHAVEHNAANYFSFPQNIWTEETIEEAIELIFKSSFSGARHQGRIMKILKTQS